MYFELTFKKLFVTILIFGALSVGVMYLFSAKNDRYGQTPFMQSIGLFTQEMLSRGSLAFDEASSVLARSARGAFATVGITLPSAAAVAPPPGNAAAVPVLTYHRLVDVDDGSNVTVANFTDQMRKLYDAGWRTTTMANFEAFMAGKKELPAKSFVITFDDGAKGSFYPVDPILEHYGFTAVEYIIAKASLTPESTYYLSPQEIKRMLATGRWEIGSHSYDGHRPYPIDAKGGEGNFFTDRLWNSAAGRLETDEEFRARVRNDLLAAKNSLEKTYGTPVTTFAFPFGEQGLIEANNFPQGASITNEEAAKVYDYGFLQTHGESYTFNYPQDREFLTKRVHVDHDWSGGRLLAELENGNPKSLPFSDDMSVDRGWVPSWGNVQAGTILSLKSEPNTSSASSILDGSLLWKNYTYSATIDWGPGYALALVEATDSRHYRACVFSEGKVQLQNVSGEGNIVVLDKSQDPGIGHGTGVVIGARVNGDTITCLWDNKPVLSVSGLPPTTGGIGIQTWDPTVGTSALVVHSVSVTPI